MTWELIEQIDLAAPAASIMFDEGLGGYSFYRVTGYVQSSSPTYIRARLNGDTGENYDYQDIAAISTSVVANRTTHRQQVVLSRVTGTGANSFGLLIAKPTAGAPARVLVFTGVQPPASLGLSRTGGQWVNLTDVISSIEIFADFAAGTSVILEGLAV